MLQTPFRGEPCSKSKRDPKEGSGRRWLWVWRHWPATELRRPDLAWSANSGIERSGSRPAGFGGCIPGWQCLARGEVVAGDPRDGCEIGGLPWKACNSVRSGPAIRPKRGSRHCHLKRAGVVMWNLRACGGTSAVGVGRRCRRRRWSTSGESLQVPRGPPGLCVEDDLGEAGLEAEGPGSKGAPNPGRGFRGTPAGVDGAGEQGHRPAGRLRAQGWRRRFHAQTPAKIRVAGGEASIRLRRFHLGERRTWSSAIRAGGFPPGGRIRNAVDSASGERNNSGSGAKAGVQLHPTKGILGGGCPRNTPFRAHSPRKRCRGRRRPPPLQNRGWIFHLHGELAPGLEVSIADQQAWTDPLRVSCRRTPRCGRTPAPVGPFPRGGGSSLQTRDPVQQGSR